MQNLIASWQALEPRRRFIVVAATLAMFAAVLGLSSLASRADMALLYAGLEDAQAGEVITALDQQGARYEVRGNAIYVESQRRDQLRLTLAGDGLPANGGAGYELLDSLSGFGTTSQMFGAAYWRAREGELARTIVSSPQIRSARVHIATPDGASFGNRLRPTASVGVTTQGEGLPANHAKALRFLVASAVTGMRPEDVSIIDSEAGLIASGDDMAGQQGAEDRATKMKRNVERLLEARVGYGNAVVELSVDTVMEQEAITERRFDPESRVAISSDVTETSETSENSGPPPVSVASNLPDGDAEAGGSRSQTQNSETRERVNYEVSETTRELLRAPGAIRRITVAVLVDGIQLASADGVSEWAPRPEEELSALRELVASAVGYDEARGDVITIKSLAFQPMAELGTAADSALLRNMPIDMMSLIRLAVLALVALILGLFVLRPLLTRPTAPSRSELTGETGESSQGVLTGEIQDSDFVPGPMTVVSDFDIGGGPGEGQEVMNGNSNFDGTASADPVARLKRLIGERQDESVEILRGWMDEREAKA